MGERGRGRFGNRRPSHDRKSNFQPTVLQRPRRMSELSARSDRSSSRDEIPQSVVAEQSQSPPQQHQQMPPVSLPAVVEGSPSSRPTELTAAQREVMLSAAERAKKRRDEEEAEFAAIRERARKKAEALAAMCESKSPKSSTDAAKPEEKKPALDANAVATTDTAPKSENKSPVDGNKTTTDKISTTNDAEKQKPEEPLSETGGKDEPATSSTPSANKKDVKASPQPPTDKPHEKEGSDEDDQRWNDYVGNLKESKPAERASTSDSNASAWNAYATRLQSSSEKRMNAAIDKYAAERNLDPSLFDDMRHTDREPLRLHRQQRGDYQGRDSRDRRGQNNRNDRNDHRQHRDEHISSKRRDKTSANGSTGEHSVSPINVELWPALGQQTNDDTATTTSSSPAKPTKKKTEQKDDTVPVIPEDEVQEKEGGATAAAAALEKEEDTKPSEKNATTKSTTEASADLSPSTGADDGVGNEPVKEQKGGGEVQEPPQQPACDIDTNKQRQQEPQDYHPEEVLEPLPEMIEASESGSLVSHNITDTVPTPESESCGRARTYSAAAVFGHWTRAERHDFLQKSKESVFPEAIERLAELKPANLTFRTVSDDRQAPSVEDNNDSIATTTSFDHTRASPIMGGDHGLPNHIAGGLERGKEYMMMDPMHAAPMAAGATSSLNDFTQQQRQFSYAVPAFDGNKVSPQQHHMAAAAPMSMTAGQQNFPLLVYQVPYNNRGPFMPGSSTATTGYGVSADGQQPGMFVPASSMSQQQPQQHQQQSMMGVYLLSPHQMLPPWSGMPLNNGSNNNNTHHHRYQQHHNQRRRH
ncbi:hypothetical protein BDB00DRAFT_392768 [Zychaea mexicana]|uniref:uncharacterized protein n=1 Tax=Zychaea mexicana TaxID=64656 RepID=UPI0022FEE793|nr:uncharacterized protein BDB00DRAFT_392768 [Zychaea mexicana]KAI9498612.1 hypothetical protein BDB00DRAFT_392768 [Zychaea mexicana]